MTYWLMVHSAVNGARCTGCDFLCSSSNRHLRHSWHPCQSLKLGLIRNTLSTTVTGAGINRSQSNQLPSFHLKAVLSPPWSPNGLESPEPLIPNGNWRCCLSGSESQGSTTICTVYHPKYEHMVDQTSHKEQMVTRQDLLELCFLLLRKESSHVSHIRRSLYLYSPLLYWFQWLMLPSGGWNDEPVFTEEQPS